MNLRDLQYAVSVAEHKHFGQAAVACNVSQPTLSMQIRKLEETLGLAIFERRGRQVLVTPPGEIILAHARNALASAERIRETARASTDPEAGELRLGVIPTIAPYLLPRVMPKIGKGLPKLKPLLKEAQTGVLLEELAHGTVEAAILALPTGVEGLVESELYDEPFYLAVPRDHPLVGCKRAKIAALTHEKILLLEEGHCLRDQALEVCTLAGAGEAAFRATSLETLRQMVAAHVGVTLMPKLAIPEYDPANVYIPFADPQPSRKVGLVWRKSSPRGALFAHLASILKQTISA